MPLFPGDRPPIKVGGSRGRALRSGFDLLMRLLRRRGGNTVSMDELSRLAEHSEESNMLATKRAVNVPPRSQLPGSLGYEGERLGVERYMGFDEKTENDLINFEEKIASQDEAIDSIISDADAVEWYSTEDRRKIGLDSKLMIRRRLARENPRMLQGALNMVTRSKGEFKQSIRDELNRALNRARK